MIPSFFPESSDYDYMFEGNIKGVFINASGAGTELEFSLSTNIYTATISNDKHSAEGSFL